MSEYINREDALKLRDVFSDRQNGNKHFFSGIESACEFLEALPTVQPEVRRGKWDAKFEYEDFQYAHCSVCGKRSEYMTHFCPNCGAKMDLGVEP